MILQCVSMCCVSGSVLRWNQFGDSYAELLCDFWHRLRWPLGAIVLLRQPGLWYHNTTHITYHTALIHVLEFVSVVCGSGWPDFHSVCCWLIRSRSHCLRVFTASHRHFRAFESTSFHHDGRMFGIHYGSGNLLGIMARDTLKVYSILFYSKTCYRVIIIDCI